MIKTFKEVPDMKTADFSTLAAGDYFYYDSIYYMKLIQTYESTEVNLYGVIIIITQSILKAES